jgi:hypothetical protein
MCIDSACVHTYLPMCVCVCAYLCLCVYVCVCMCVFTELRKVWSVHVSAHKLTHGGDGGLCVWACLCVCECE